MLLSDEILNSMREESRAALLTLYLVYKRALLVEDHQLGSELLEKFLAVDQKHLLSCAVEAEKLGKTRQAIDILQGVINDLDASEQEIKVSALFQSTICLLIKEIERCKGGIDKQGLLDKAYSVFEAALKGANTRESSSTGSMFSKTEIEWFFQNACILALENLTFPRSQQIEQLLDVSAKVLALNNWKCNIMPNNVQFATIYQKCALDPEEQTNILSHHLLCCYLRSLKTVSEVRGQCDANEKKIHYETIRAAIQSFRERISSQLNNERITVKERTAWVVKHREMLYFDFEAAIYLKQWNSLASLVDEARPIITDKLCSNFMESILISNAPMRVTLRAIICTHHKTFTAKLPRYLHVLFRLALSPNGDIIVAEAVIDQVLALARQSNSTSTSQNARARFQDEELAWLATTAFNRAVDFYRDSADADCARWAGKAIEVADLVGCDEGPGGGGLAALLRRNLGLLGLDGA
ncbi:hypothetical protein PHISCL_05711 [Aspergillus sclerotialis]|uniref:Uncharacterized protein n=1 Tax=Aspergillus sclerotialis TaxID=2070753 RepID=A0A3A2ZFL6_9EURO|nr:hypothetical protein PHISCL_05711 [Aspergillus sclerotialis]